ncbi:MAG: tetratricopeptide repeat protein [Alphaproteobacteria bacterium]|nr:tetratricopeptide repeat protein [Alphaproteobacteria bacterium]
MVFVRSCLVLLVATFMATTVMADQKDARLTDLFQRLHDAEDAEESAPIQAKIWLLWHQSGSHTLDLLMERGIRAMEADDFEIALTMFNSIIEIKPEFAEGWNKRATLNYMTGRHEESIKDIERTLKLEPRHFGALSGLGMVNMAFKRNEEALKAFQRALDANPHMPGARMQVQSLERLLRGQRV